MSPARCYHPALGPNYTPSSDFILSFDILNRGAFIQTAQCGSRGQLRMLGVQIARLHLSRSDHFPPRQTLRSSDNSQTFIHFEARPCADLPKAQTGDVLTCLPTPPGVRHPLFKRGYDMNTSVAHLSYRLLYVSRRPLPRRGKMLPLPPLLDPVLEIVAASGFVASDPVPLLPHVGASVFPVFAGVEAAEVPHDQRLYQQHREGCDQGGPRPAGQPASTRAANHLRTGAARSWRTVCGSAQRDGRKEWK